MANSIVLVLFSLWSLLVVTGLAANPASDTLIKGRNITDGGTLVSAGGSFTLGFFSLGRPNKRYLGVWFTVSKDAICWVANRDRPLADTSGVLNDTSAGVLVLTATGILRLLDDGRSGQTVWSSNSTTTTSTSAVAAQLLDSGNLVVRGQITGGEVTLWQSFDHPSNTLLAGMRLGKDPQTGVEWSLTSWRAPNDPTTGDCRRVMDTKGLPDCVSWQGDVKKYRTGPWNGLWFSGVPEMASYSELFSNQVIVLPNEVAYVFNASAGAPFSRLVLSEVGVLQRLAWDPASRVWNTFAQAPRDVCDDYAMCGAFGICDVNTASTLFCGCIVGFGPVNPTQWSMRESGAGCRRNAPLECGNGTTTDGFMVVRGMRVPDKFVFLRNRSFEQCVAECSRNCSCTAYAYANLSSMADQSRCLLWTGELIDTWKSSNYGETLSQLITAHILTSFTFTVKMKTNLLKIVLPVIACLLLPTSIALVCICKLKAAGKWRKKEIQQKLMLGYLSASSEIGDKNVEFPFVSFNDIVAATDNFSDCNMLGRGGFGKVYKGMLEGGKEVAVKRLIQGSGQGIDEFRNEVVLLVKLQHRNLVRLLGCCIHEDEKLLIYEYLPNKSLDAFLFDTSRKHVLDWPTRFKIVKGVARGLLYLHRDSRLTIIHRDLKASNILLDTEMSPKISDFGMARIFGENQQLANTTRIAGTYGYMSPEYVTSGSFSVKSDTYSFGVLLEIISGLRIISTQFLADFPSLIAYTWRLWEDGNAMELADSSMAENCPVHEVLRCIHVGLLCVQDNPDARLLMSSVMFMLENATTLLPAPKEPVYFAPRNNQTEGTMRNVEGSLNTWTITALEGR
ncbi:hypothetical protein HU200_063533 [Digitaria exilis]|uniref:Receptor-like serine/threonine-protein kinase n=1 Tax=Digitaria exilis TaxID=1010633 RepID=A0A835A735_9POAL|nr:hypothetical protein HU200_063533 [Digitaria exilis]